MFFIILLLTLNELVVGNKLSECQYLRPTESKILETTDTIHKVWLGSEVAVSCCSKISDAGTDDYFQEQYDSNGNSIEWFGPNNERLINYFSDPTRAEKIGVFYIPDMSKLTDNIRIIHLVIKNYTKSNDGIYKCGSYPNTNMGIDIKGYPKVMIDTERIQYLEEDKEGNIECKPRGHKEQQYKMAWFFNDQYLKPGDNHLYSFLDSHTVLRITKVTEQSSGMYICKAEVVMDANQPDHGSYIEIQPIRVVVYKKPTLSDDSPIIKSLSTNNLHVAAIEDGSLELACDSVGLPPPDIYWYLNGHLLNASNSRITITESYYRRNAYSNLKIEPVLMKDVGNYSCVANVRFEDEVMGSVMKNITPEFAFQPRFINSRSELNATSFIGQNIILNCSISGAYSYRLSTSFVKEGYDKTIQYFNDSMEHSRFKFVTFQDLDNPYISYIQLHIYDVNPTDAGWYYCRARLKSTPIFSHSHLGVVSVMYSPKIITTQSLQYGLRYRENKLHCKAQGFPQIQWQWFFRNFLITDQFKHKDRYRMETIIKNDTSSSILRIRPNYENDMAFGSYNCVATNQLGNDSFNIIMHQATRPSAPNVQICKIDASSIQLCVSAHQETGGLPLTHYELRVSEYGQTQFNGPYYYPVKPNTITLSHLKPNTTYKMALSAASEAGRGPNTYAEARTSPVSAPKIELINTSESPDWNAFNLRWKVESDGGLPIVQYNVQIQQVRIDSQGNVVERVKPPKNIVINNLSEIKKYFRVNSLKPKTWYELRFQARNLWGPSMLQQVVFKTLDFPPSKARSQALYAARSNSNYLRINMNQFGMIFIIIVFWRTIQ